MGVGVWCYEGGRGGGGESAVGSRIHEERKFKFFTGFLPSQGASVLRHDAKRGCLFISDAFSSTLTDIC